jgi:hypothetical protein
MFFRELFIIIACVFLFSGCASHHASHVNESQSFARQGEWKNAYRSLEVPLRKEQETERIDNLIKQYPEIVAVGAEQTFMSYLDKVKKDCTTENINLYFAYLKELRDNPWARRVSRSILDKSKNTLNQCASTPGIGVRLCSLVELEPFVGQDYFSKQVKESAARFEQVVVKAEQEDKKRRTGIVLSAQVSDESHINSGAGAQVGALYGQAGYIDSASWQNYSATSQITYGLAGAIIGGLLLDAPTQSAFRLTYFVKMSDGNIKKIETTSDSATRIPEGVCVEIYEPSYLAVVNQNNCSW